MGRRKAVMCRIDHPFGKFRSGIRVVVLRVRIVVMNVLFVYSSKSHILISNRSGKII